MTGSTGTRSAPEHVDRLRSLLLAQDGVRQVTVPDDGCEPLTVRVELASRVRDEALARHLAGVDQVFGMMVDTSSADQLDTSVWLSGITRRPLEEAVMREWVDRTVDSIRRLRPRRVLEIGCGTGLLASRIAPDCERYVGTDISEQVLGRLLANLDRAGGRPASLRTLRRAAHDFTGVEGPFDVVVINSVVQYFPTIDYLFGVLDEAWRLLAPDGVLFIGDVRSLPLLTAYHEEAVRTAAPTAPPAQVRAQARRRAAEERELVIDPELFVRWAERHQDADGADVRFKQGGDNELTRYRYDVFIPRGARPSPPAPEVTWPRRGPVPVLVRDVPNPRVVSDRDVPAFLDQLRAGAGEVRMQWPKSLLPNRMDVLAGDNLPTVHTRQWHSGAALAELATEPLLIRLRATLERRWRTAVRAELPEPRTAVRFEISFADAR
jgi:2-polyprenyl-3-methyl-5-hydroxy-6-metoxy-1,4-benzoquinol methylase